MRFTLVIYPPVPNDGMLPAEMMTIDPEITQLSWSTGPGGFNGLSVGIRNPERPQFGFLPRQPNIDFYYDVWVLAGAQWVWNGRIQDIVRPDGEVTGFKAVGYGIAALTDGYYINASTTPTTAGQLLADVIAQAAPLLGVNPDPNLFVDSGLAVTPSQVSGMAPAQIVQKLSTDGGGANSNNNNAPYDWRVWEDRIALFTPRLSPPNWIGLPAGARGAPYWIDFKGVDWSENATDAVGAVTVTYTGGTVPQVGPFLSSSFAQRYRVGRAVNLQAGTRSDAEAVQFGKTYLRLHEQPLVSATIHRQQNAGLTLALGRVEYPPWLIRAFDWCQVGDQEPIILLTTQYDPNTEAFTATGANYPADYWEDLRRLEEITRAYQVAVHPLTHDSTSQAYGVRTRYAAGLLAPADMPDSGGIVVTDAGLFVNAGGTILGPIS